MTKKNLITRENILDDYTDYVMLLKSVRLHKFEYSAIYREYKHCECKDIKGNDLSLNLKKPPIDEGIIDELIALKGKYISLKKTFDEMIKESELEYDNFKMECIKWLFNNMFLDGDILTKDYFFDMLKYFEVDEDGYCFNDTCYHILCEVDELVTDYKSAYNDVLKKIKGKVEELKKLILE